MPQTSGFAKAGLAPHIYGIMQQTNAFTIREQVKLMPEYCFGCPPCLAQVRLLLAFRNFNTFTTTLHHHREKVTTSRPETMPRVRTFPVCCSVQTKFRKLGIVAVVIPDIPGRWSSDSTSRCPVRFKDRAVRLKSLDKT